MEELLPSCLACQAVAAHHQQRLLGKVGHLPTKPRRVDGVQISFSNLFKGVGVRSGLRHLDKVARESCFSPLSLAACSPTRTTV